MAALQEVKLESFLKRHGFHDLESPKMIGCSLESFCGVFFLGGKYAQLMVNCWFVSRWFGFLESPKMKGIGNLGCTPIESQTTGSQTNN